MFVGWYTDASYTGSPATFPYFSKTQLILYAKWLPATDGLEYVLLKDEGYAVSGIGTAAGKTEIYIPPIYMGLPVIGIDTDAFYGCDYLTSVVLREGIVYIGMDAFANCVSLVNVTLPSTLVRIDDEAFYGCDSLTGIVLPEGLEELGRMAFAFCGSLETIDIPASVFSIGLAPFAGCASLTSIGVDADNVSYLSIDGVLFDIDTTVLIQYPIGKTGETYTVPEGVTEIGMYAFSYGTGLLSVFLPAELQIICAMAFNSSMVTSVVFAPDSQLTDIGEHAFGYSAVTEIVLPEGLTTIGEGAFTGAMSLLSIVIPANVYNLGYEVFFGCEALQSVTFAEGSLLDTIPENAFAYTAMLGDVRIPDGITDIFDTAFAHSGLQSIVIPVGVSYIVEAAFYYCYGATIYCEASSEPTSWDPLWNFEGGTVIWGTDGIVREYTFEPLGGSAVAPYTCIQIPQAPDSFMADYYLEDWYTDPAYTGSPVVFPYFSKTQFTLYAKWPSGTEGLDYVLVEGGEAYAVSGIGSASEETIILVPSTYMGLPVIGIEDHAFEWCSDLERVGLPGSLKYIGEGAFESCYMLSKVNLPSGLFRIDQDAFYGCPSLTSVLLPEGLLEIGDYAFSGTGLETIEIPASVTVLGEVPFGVCTSLTSINVAPGNAVYQSINGVVFDITGTVLLMYPSGRPDDIYTISESVTEIGDFAFYTNRNLSVIVIPAGVEKIGDNAFFDCVSLRDVTFAPGSQLTTIGVGAFAATAIEEIVIPEGVTFLGSSAFSICEYLVSVRFPQV